MWEWWYLCPLIVLCHRKAIEKLVKMPFVLHQLQLCSKLKSLTYTFCSSSATVKLPIFARSRRPKSFYLSPWFQAKRLSANNIPGQKHNQKHSVVLCTGWQQVCSCDGCLCDAVTFNLLVKGQNLLEHHWHSNWTLQLWDWMFLQTVTIIIFQSLSRWVKMRSKASLHLNL